VELRRKEIFSPGQRRVRTLYFMIFRFRATLRMLGVLPFHMSRREGFFLKKMKNLRNAMCLPLRSAWAYDMRT